MVAAEKCYKGASFIQTHGLVQETGLWNAFHTCLLGLQLETVYVLSGLGPPEADGVDQKGSFAAKVSWHSGQFAPE